MLNALLWNLLVTTGAAIVLAVVCRFPSMCRRPALRHWLWLLLLIKLVTPPLIPVPLLPARAPSRGLAETAMSSRSVPGHGRPKSERVFQGTAAVDSATFASAAEAAGDARGVASREIRSDGQVPYLVGLFAVSITGTCLLLTIHGFHAAKLCRWLKRAGAANSLLAQSCSDVASRLGIRREVRSCVVDARTAPLLWGWRRPIVVLPRRLIDELRPDQLRSIVAHELAHYLRGDHWANLFAFLVKMLMWWNPVTWWAHREVRAAQELCCDAITIERCSTNRRCYAMTLLRALEFIQTEPLAQRRLALGMGSKRSVLRRFEMICDAQLSYRLSRSTLLIVMILGILLICFPVRSQERATPAVATPDLSDGVVAADPTAEPAAKRPENVDTVRSAVQIELLDDSEVIILRGKQEDVEKVADLIRRIEQGQPKSIPAVKDDPIESQQGPQVEVEVYALGELDPQSVNLVLRTLLAGRPEVRLDVDPKTRQLIVLAPPADHATVRAILEKLRPGPASAKPDVAGKEREEEKKAEETGDRPVPWVIYLRHAQAGQVAEVVREVYHDRQKDLSVQIVPGLNAVIVVAPDALFWQIKELMEALDRAVTEAHETVLTVPGMRGENLQRLREAIERGMKADELQRRARLGSSNRRIRGVEEEHRARQDSSSRIMRGIFEE